MYWSQALVAQTEDAGLAERFEDLAVALVTNEQTILDELLAAQGAPVDLGGYYLPDEAKVSAAMRPSATLNRILAEAAGASATADPS
jgi:isocitrate dehydrogenase